MGAIPRSGLKPDVCSVVPNAFMSDNARRIEKH